MSLTEDLETLDLSPAQEVQRAYDQSAGTEFRGDQMRPWTIARQSAAMSLGVNIVKAIGPDVLGMLRSASYPNILRDVIICGWLCSIDDKAVMQINYQPAATNIEAAFEWANKHGIAYGSEPFFEILKLIDTIVSGILASCYAIDANTPAADKKKENTNQPGKSKSRTTRQKPADIAQPT